MRQTGAGRLFARLTTAVESEARRSGRSVIVRTRGADESIDRRVAEKLVEPRLQLSCATPWRTASSRRSFARRWASSRAAP